MVDLVEGDDGGELLIDKVIDDAPKRLVGPVLEGFPGGGAAEGADDDGRRGTVARKLALQRLGGRGLDGRVAAADRRPPLRQVAEGPGDDLGAQPGDVDGRVVAARLLAVGVDGARGVDDVDEGVGVAQVVEELVAQAAALVRAGDQPGDIEELDGDGAPAADACAVVGLAAVRDAEAGARAVDLDVADGPLGVDGGESGAAPRVSLAQASAVPYGRSVRGVACRRISASRRRLPSQR